MYTKIYTRASLIITYAAWKLSLLVVLALILFLFSAVVPAQSPPPTADQASTNSEDQHAAGSLEEEMKAKRAIKFAESEHKENLDRAHEVSELGHKLRESFENKHSLDREDNKRLDRLEKLAKQLRSKAGGSSTDVTLEKPPVNLEGTLCRLAEVSESFANLVQKTPRQVVSTTVIDEANVLLQLIDLARQFSR